MGLGRRQHHLLHKLAHLVLPGQVKHLCGKVVAGRRCLLTFANVLAHLLLQCLLVLHVLGFGVGVPDQAEVRIVGDDLVQVLQHAQLDPAVVL